MIGKIGYLVQGASDKQRTGTDLLFLHITGGAAAGLGVGAVFSLAANVLPQGSAVPVAAIFVLGLLAMLDLGVVRMPWQLPERQTPGYLTCALGDRAGVFVWGMDLGSIVTTRPPLYVSLAVPFLAVATGSVWGAVLTACAYGLGRTAAVAAAVRHGSESPDGTCTAVARGRDARVIGAGVVSIAIACLIGSQVAVGSWR